MRRLIEVVHRLETGDLKARYGGEAAAGEFNQLGQALNQMAEKLENKVVSLSAREARFRHEALHDTLTGLPNRRILEQTVPLWLKEAEADGGDPIAILLVDLDGFKQVNDKRGHGFGDAVLAAASQRLRGCTRTADLVARLGGDEFVVGLRGKQQQAVETARRIVDRLAMPLRIGNHRLQIGASVGIVTASNQMLPVPALLRMADMALYQAKADGRSTYRVWEGTTYPSAA